jgi:hypothetical protein
VLLSIPRARTWPASHCTNSCDGANSGPCEEDIDQSLWASPTLGRKDDA